MARSITSFGTELARASRMARRRRGFFSGSGSPILAATVISLESFEKSLERAASWRPLRCWILAHLEWPAMKDPRSKRVNLRAFIRACSLPLQAADAAPALESAHCKSGISRVGDRNRRVPHQRLARRRGARA